MLSQAIPVRDDSSAVVIEFPLNKNVVNISVPKYRNNGEKKLTHSNSVVGVSNKTHAIKDEELLSSYINYYAKRKDLTLQDMKMYTLVMFELCSGLRVSDVIQRTWSDLMLNEHDYRDCIRIRQKKTSKYGEFNINEMLRDVLDGYRAMLYRLYKKFDLDWYLFPSNSSRGNGHITRQTAWNWCKYGAVANGIELSVGNHGLRKTFGYTSMKLHNDDATFLAVLMRVYGHSSERVTLAYCGIDEDDNRRLYNDVGKAYRRALYQ